MAETKTLVIWIFFIVIFNLFTGMLISESTNSNVDIKNYMVVSKVKDKFLVGDDLFTNIIRVVTVPFLLIDLLLVVVVLMGISFSVLPPIIELLVFSPLILIITLDYLIPMFRGN